MDIKANARKGFILKFLLIGLAALAFGGLHLKDAIFSYPALRVHADAYEEMRGPANEKGDYMISDGDLQAAWIDYAEPLGLPETEPKLHDEIHNLILYNYFIGIIFSAMGLWCLLVGLPAIGKWIQISDGKLSTKSGAGIDLKDITTIDKSRWEKKGLAKVSGKNADGKVCTVVVDDIKFEREPADKIMAEIERVAGEDKITAGKPESEYAQLRIEKEAQRQEREKAMNEMSEDE